MISPERARCGSSGLTDVDGVGYKVFALESGELDR